MPTKQPRLNVTLNPAIIGALSYLAQKDQKSLSNIAQELIQEALELREDLYLSKLADEAEARAIGKPRIKAKDTWKKAGLK